MIIMGLVVFSFLLLMAVLLVTILFGAAARESEKDMQLRADLARLEAEKPNVSLTDEPYRDHTVPG
jgi:cytochrome oxidase Cu insertion factor (SCO1/SenC/PrrC family)